MTNLERVISLLGFQPAANSVEGALLDAGIEASDDYAAENKNDIKKVAISVAEVLLSSADTTNGQGDFTIKYDRAALQALIKQWKKDVGIVDDPVSVPTIRGRRAW